MFLSQTVAEGFITFVWMRDKSNLKQSGKLYYYRYSTFSLYRTCFDILTFFVNFLLCVSVVRVFFKPVWTETNPPAEWHFPGDTITQVTLYPDPLINTEGLQHSFSICWRANNKRQLTGHNKGYVFIDFMQFWANAFYKWTCIIIGICWLQLCEQQKSYQEAISYGNLR